MPHSTLGFWGFGGLRDTIWQLFRFALNDQVDHDFECSETSPGSCSPSALPTRVSRSPILRLKTSRSPIRRDKRPEEETSKRVVLVARSRSPIRRHLAHSRSPIRRDPRALSRSPIKRDKGPIQPENNYARHALAKLMSLDGGV